MPEAVVARSSARASEARRALERPRERGPPGSVGQRRGDLRHHREQRLEGALGHAEGAEQPPEIGDGGGHPFGVAVHRRLPHARGEDDDQIGPASGEAEGVGHDGIADGQGKIHRGDVAAVGHATAGEIFGKDVIPVAVHHASHVVGEEGRERGRRLGPVEAEEDVPEEERLKNGP
ncbi:MAG: hypothetical protein MUF34_00825, partial [Polyangiaceae bacterium]|nr:hypothetical protein [Polyangiaceae bacterium]